MFQQDLVEGFGYPFQAHEVSSHTGYILSLHRIPYGMKRRQSNGTKRPVALFQHGLVSASDMWLFQGPNINLRKLSVPNLTNCEFQRFIHNDYTFELFKFG